MLVHTIYPVPYHEFDVKQTFKAQVLLIAMHLLKHTKNMFVSYNHLCWVISVYSSGHKR